jgi:hypothetical protein
MARSKRGSTLAAALALVFLIFLVTCASLARVASSWTQVGLRHRQSSALLLAEAGIQNAAHRLLRDEAYTGERSVALPTGTFNVSVDRSGSDYIVTSTGYVKSPIKSGLRKTIRATVIISGSDSFRIMNWKEDP